MFWRVVCGCWLAVFQAMVPSLMLTCHVEEGELPSLEHRLGDLLPLLWCGVHSRGVVGTSMEQENAPPRRGLRGMGWEVGGLLLTPGSPSSHTASHIDPHLDVLEESVEVQSPGLGKVVPGRKCGC